MHYYTVNEDASLDTLLSHVVTAYDNFFVLLMLENKVNNSNSAPEYATKFKNQQIEQEKNFSLTILFLNFTFVDEL